MNANPELVHDILRAPTQPLDAFFAPKSVAVVGATETVGSVGRTVLANLLAGPFPGALYPVNPKRPTVLGVKAYPNLGALPEAVDLAVLVTPAPSVPDLVGDCVKYGVKAAIIISAGFKEIGPEGTALEQRIVEQVRGSSLRIIGPNCLGVMIPSQGMNATFAAAMARPGKVAFISQSGAILTAILDWSLQENVGFSAFVSVGSMLDVGWGDLITYLGDDPRTESIILYMESIGNARAFLSAAREVALRKPVIVIKAGRSEAAAKAAASHTGALTGSDEVLDAALRRCGVLRVANIADVFYMAETLSKQPRPRGPRLTILTNAGGPGVLAVDALTAHGGEPAQLSAETLAELNQILPPQWSHNNPIDILGDAGPERYAKAVEIAAQDPNSDGLLVILTPQAMTDPTRTAEHLQPYARKTGKPILASWMGGAGVAAGVEILNRADIPTFPYPDTAARAFDYMWRYTYNLRGLYETPALPAEAEGGPDRGAVERLLLKLRQAGRTLLTEFEAKQVLAAYRIPTVATQLAVDEASAVRAAEELSYPVVLKLHSETITHKTDVGGVQLNLLDAEAVRQAFRTIRATVAERAGERHFNGVTVQRMAKLDGYELILGSSIDAQFGPVLLFGTGGQLVEVFKDRALALPPLNTTLARRMMEQTKIFSVFKGVRGRAPIDVGAVEQLLVHFSQLVVEQPWIKEIDINPLLVSPERLLALDARMVLHDADTLESVLPKPAIRPYPLQYVSTWTLKDGSSVTIRPIRPEDEPLLVKFHETLSEESVYLRYLNALQLSQRVQHERLSRICFIDYDREIALVPERVEANGACTLLGVGRLVKKPGSDEAEFSLLVSDRVQRSGLGTELLRRLIQIGRDEKLKTITADILPQNNVMQKVCEKLGFELKHDFQASLMKACLELKYY